MVENVIRSLTLIRWKTSLCQTVGRRGGSLASHTLSGFSRGVVLMINTLRSHTQTACSDMSDQGKSEQGEPPVLSHVQCTLSVRMAAPLEPKQWRSLSLLMGYPDLCYPSISIECIFI